MLIPGGRLCPEPSEREDRRSLSRTEEDKRRLLRWVEQTENDLHRPRRHMSLQETRRQPIHQEPLRRGKKKVKTSVTCMDEENEEAPARAFVAKSVSC